MATRFFPHFISLEGFLTTGYKIKIRISVYIQFVKLV